MKLEIKHNELLRACHTLSCSPSFCPNEARQLFSLSPWLVRHTFCEEWLSSDFDERKQPIVIDNLQRPDRNPIVSYPPTPSATVWSDPGAWYLMTPVGLSELKNRINRTCDHKKPIRDQTQRRITENPVSGTGGGGGVVVWLMYFQSFLSI